MCPRSLTDTEGERRWRIGELVEATGLTARALRHYERIGLLSPPRRTSAGHRVYSDDDVSRLRRICALKSIGLSLAEIESVLHDDTELLTATLAGHLRHVELEAHRLSALRKRLAHILAYLDEPAASEELVALVDATTQMERHFSSRQLDFLAARRAALGADGIRESRDRWRELGTSLRGELDAGAEVGSPAVKALARRAQGYLDDFTGRDPGTGRALARLRAMQPPRDFQGWDAELMAFLDDAIDQLD